RPRGPTDAATGSGRGSGSCTGSGHDSSDSGSRDTESTCCNGSIGSSAAPASTGFLSCSTSVDARCCLELESVGTAGTSNGCSVDGLGSVANPGAPRGRTDGCITVLGSSSSSSSSGFFADQFENLANYRAHYCGTGPEIWKQTGGTVDAFVAAAGTGGTIAGISCYLKEQNPGVKTFLIDPPGSSLFHKVTRGVLYTRQEAEGKRLRNPFDTITEGIGINRLTANFNAARIDGAFRGTDREAVEMARYLLRSDGLFIGSSSAMNCVGAVRVAEKLGPGHTIVTMLCDSGFRHLSKFHNEGYLREQGLVPSAKGLEFMGGRFAEGGGA
ncbi:unnamed protein product, partial [Closterium sp. NIES-64]